MVWQPRLRQGPVSRPSSPHSAGVRDCPRVQATKMERQRASKEIRAACGPESGGARDEGGT
jgi:hypothetical protein